MDLDLTDDSDCIFGGERDDDPAFSSPEDISNTVWHKHCYRGNS
jgi:hypothetical protein